MHAGPPGQATQPRQVAAQLRGARLDQRPAARLDDGLLEVVVIGAIGKLEFLRTFPKVFSGRHVDHPAVAVHRAARVDLDADRTLAVYADGEPAGTLPATFEVRPAAVTVLAADPAPGFPAGPGP
jgi:diacylglycerol kinase (ATP)